MQAPLTGLQSASDVNLFATPPIEFVKLHFPRNWMVAIILPTRFASIREYETFCGELKNHAPAPFFANLADVEPVASAREMPTKFCNHRQRVGF